MTDREQMLWARINDLEDAAVGVLDAAKEFIQNRPEEMDYTPGEKKLIEELAYLGDLVGYGEQEDAADNG